MTVEAGAFTGEELPALVAFFDANGYATLRGAFNDAELSQAEDELVRVQEDLARGNLDPRHGTAVLDDPEATIGGQPFAGDVGSKWMVKATPGQMSRWGADWWSVCQPIRE